jgi:hypothetical protein
LIILSNNLISSSVNTFKFDGLLFSFSSTFSKGSCPEKLPTLALKYLMASFKFFISSSKKKENLLPRISNALYQ